MPPKGYEPVGSASEEYGSKSHSHSLLEPSSPKYETQDVITNYAQVPTEVKPHKKRIYAIISLFFISLFCFVSQTELTSYLYNGLNFNQPYLLLYLTHSSWIFIWPIQVFSIALFKHFKKCRSIDTNCFEWTPLRRHIHDSLKNQHKNVFKTSGFLINNEHSHDHQYPQSILQFIGSESIISLMKKTALLTLILNVAGCTWYFAMAVSPASDVTAIYNSSAFSALMFAIPILKEKFTYLKLSAVLLATFGAIYVSTSGGNSKTDFPYRFWGDLVISLGAVLYGLYEVLYKKLACPPNNSVSSRRQVAFSNFCASMLGMITMGTLWLLIVFVHVFDISRFDISGFTPYVWLIIILSIVSNLVFSLSFLALMSLTSPVLSAVSSLITILFVGLFEWLLFGVELSAQQIVGDLLIVAGFVVLSYSYWNEINTDDIDEEEDATDVDSTV